MDLSKINTASLRAVLKLSERKEKLLAELSKVEAEILGCLSGTSLCPSDNESKKAKTVKSSFSKSQRTRRGAMKEQILKTLAEAGTEGIKVPELAQKIGAKNANVHVWLSSNSKKHPEIERIGAGFFRIRSY